MKKILSVLMILMLSSVLVGCMDDPDDVGKSQKQSAVDVERSIVS